MKAVFTAVQVLWRSYQACLMVMRVHKFNLYTYTGHAKPVDGYVSAGKAVFSAAVEFLWRSVLKWSTCTIGSRDTAGGQGPQNHHRKCTGSADSAAQSQLPFTIEKIDGKHILCGCSREEYLACKHYINQSWDASRLR